MISHVPSGSALKLEQSEAAFALQTGEMLSPRKQTNLKNAKTDFEEHLAVGDYYGESEQVVGEWIGTGVGLLNLGTIVA